MPESIGYQLKCARQEHHLSLEKVSEATRIRPYHLEALEADDYSKMPSAAQARGFLRLYAEFLGLDIEQMLDELRRAQGGAPQDEIVGPTPVAESGPDAGLIADLAEPTEESDKAPHQVIALAGKIRSLVQLVRDRVGGKAAETQPEQDEGRPQLEVELESEELVSETEKDEDASSTAQVAEAEEGDREQEQLFHLETAKGEARPFWVPWLNSLRAWLRLRLVVEAKESQPEAEGDQETMPAPGVQLLSSQEIFAEIGLQLRQRREMLSLSLDEIEQHIHVRGHLLRALELGNFDQLPSPVQTRGMLSNYADFLDMETEAVLLHFAEGLQTRHRERHLDQAASRKAIRRPRPGGIPPLRSFIASDLVFGAGMIILLLAVAIWGASRINRQRLQSKVESTAPSISDVLLATPISSVESAAGTATVLPETAQAGQGALVLPVSTAADNVNVQLNIVAVERTFMRVTVDGKVKFDGRVVPGNAYPFEAENQIDVLTGNAAALRIVYNQRDLGLMGDFGQVVNLVYLAEGIATPTSAPTATGTATLRVTPTPNPTQTPTPTSTPTP